MAKIFYTDGVGAQQTLNESDSNKIKVYDSYDDIDTTDLVDGEIVSTKETSADGSNVYDYINGLVDLGPDYANGVTTQLSTTSGSTSTGALLTTFTATEDCYFVARHYTVNAGSAELALNLTICYGSLSTIDTSTAIYSTILPGVYGAAVANPPIRLSAGETITISYGGYNARGYCKNYTVYPVKRGN